MTREEAQDLLHDLIFAYDNASNHPKKPSYYEDYLAKREKILEAITSPDPVANGIITAMVQTAGGMVEGMPTQRINVLQRIRQLVGDEQKMAALVAAGDVLVDEITERGTHTTWKPLAAALRALRTTGEVVHDPSCRCASCEFYRTELRRSMRGDSIKPLFSTAWEREDYERKQRGEPERGPPW